MVQPAVRSHQAARNAVFATLRVRNMTIMNRRDEMVEQERTKEIVTNLRKDIKAIERGEGIRTEHIRPGKSDPTPWDN